MFYWLKVLGFLRYAKKQRIRIVLCFSDKVEMFEKTYLYNISELKKTLDMVVTYNEKDAKKYSIVLANPIVWDFSDFFEETFLRSERDIDVFFIGSEKGRTRDIDVVFEKCSASGLKCAFYVLGSAVGANSRKEGINYLSSPIKYEEVLKVSCRSKAIVNLLQNGSSGVTIRDSEAYSFGTFLITNNKCDELTSFLDEKQIINISNDGWEKRLIEILCFTKRFPKKPNPYSNENYYDYLLNILEKQKTKNHF